MSTVNQPGRGSVPEAVIGQIFDTLIWKVCKDPVYVHGAEKEIKIVGEVFCPCRKIITPEGVGVHRKTKAVGVIDKVSFCMNKALLRQKGWQKLWQPPVAPGYWHEI